MSLCSHLYVSLSLPLFLSLFLKLCPLYPYFLPFPHHLSHFFFSFPLSSSFSPAFSLFLSLFPYVLLPLHHHPPSLSLSSHLPILQLSFNLSVPLFFPSLCLSSLSLTLGMFSLPLRLPPLLSFSLQFHFKPFPLYFFYVKVKPSLFLPIAPASLSVSKFPLFMSQYI